MLILHTSDWHLGNNLYGFDRTDEFEGMLAQIIDTVAERKPDALLISGDICDVSQPNSATQRMYADTMAELRRVAPDMVIVSTAGNHDSAARHQTVRAPFELLNIYSVGDIEPDNLDDNIIELPGKGFIAAVPFVSSRRMPADYCQRLLDRVAQLNTQQLPVVLMAHTTVRGSEFEGHERSDDFMVGGIDFVELADMGSGYDYLALGHIHKPQWIHGSERRARYSGTPLAVSFDETYAHSVSLVSIADHGAQPELELVEIRNPRPLVTLPPAGAMPWSKALDEVAKQPDDCCIYLRLMVNTDEPVPSDYRQAVAEVCGERDIRFCRYKLVKSDDKAGTAAAAQPLSIDEFKEIQPVDVVRRYAEESGNVMTDEMETLLREIIANLPTE